MKDFVNAFTQAMANRLKAPFLGSFVLCWIAVNHKFIVEFIFSTSPEKITLVQGSVFDCWTDIFFPLGLAVLYTFGLPVVQYVVDLAKRKLIDERRIEAKQSLRKFQYEQQRDAAQVQAEASLSYQQDKLNRNLQDWATERDNLNDEIDALKKDLADEKQQHTDHVASLTESHDQALQSTIDKHNAEINLIHSDHEKVKSELEEKLANNIQRAGESANELQILLKTVRTAKGLMDLTHSLSSTEKMVLNRMWKDILAPKKAPAKATKISSGRSVDVTSETKS